LLRSDQPRAGGHGSGCGDPARGRCTSSDSRHRDLHHGAAAGSGLGSAAECPRVAHSSFDQLKVSSFRRGSWVGRRKQPQVSRTRMAMVAKGASDFVACCDAAELSDERPRMHDPASHRQPLVARAGCPRACPAAHASWSAQVSRGRARAPPGPLRSIWLGMCYGGSRGPIRCCCIPLCAPCRCRAVGCNPPPEPPFIVGPIARDRTEKNSATIPPELVVRRMRAPAAEK
jgi:hypothetical protein